MECRNCGVPLTVQRVLVEWPSYNAARNYWFSPGWYQVEVRGFNLAGDGDPTVEIIQTHAYNSSNNLGSSLLPDIEQLEVEVQSQTSVQLWWRVAEQHQKLVSFYTVRYLTLPPTANEPTRIIHSMVNEVLVTGLKPFTWYEFSVRAHISENVYGPYCPVVEVSTTDRVPAAPTDLQYRPLDASTVLVTWQAPSSPAAAAIGTSESHSVRQVTPLPTMYELLYSQNKSLALPLWTKISVMSDKTQSKVSGLVSNTEYFFRIRGCSMDDRCGASSDPLPVVIRAWLDHPNSSAYTHPNLLYALVGTLCVLLLATLIICCLIRSRASNCRSHQPAAVATAADGSHMMNGLNRYSRTSCGGAGPTGGAGHLEMEVYVPMLTQIPPDFSSGPLDAKGVYTDHCVVNGFNNSRCTSMPSSPLCTTPAAPPTLAQSNGESRDCESDVNATLLHQHSNGTAVPLRVECKAGSQHSSDVQLADGSCEATSCLLAKTGVQEDSSPERRQSWASLPAGRRDQLYNKEDDVRIQTRVRPTSLVFEGDVEVTKRSRHELENDVRISSPCTESPADAVKSARPTSDAPTCSANELSRLGFADPFWASSGDINSSSSLVDGNSVSGTKLSVINNNNNNNNNSDDSRNSSTECNGLPSTLSSSSKNAVTVRAGDAIAASVS
ncbi:Fibronectin type III [Trinorchestia longiramus]|nr:Fibronectin type III [Trinorchestia longiramus]